MAKILGLQPRTAAIAGGGILAAAVGYFWWRNRQSSSAPAAASGTGTTGCTDSTGASVPCPDASGIDYSGELSVIQSELESLLAAEGQSGSSSSGTGTGTTTVTGTVTVPKVTGMTATAAVAALKAAGLVAGSEGKNGGAATVNSQTPGAGAKVAAGSTVDLGLAQDAIKGSPPPPVAGQVPGPVTGLTTSAVTAGGFRATWREPAGTTHYSYDVTYQGKQVKSGSVTSAAVTVSGLTRNHTYTFHVRACSAAGCGPAAEAAVKTRA